nr:hypothetical protein [Thiocapsa sp. KS1]
MLVLPVLRCSRLFEGFDLPEHIGHGRIPLHGDLILERLPILGFKGHVENRKPAGPSEIVDQDGTQHHLDQKALAPDAATRIIVEAHDERRAEGIGLKRRDVGLLGQRQHQRPARQLLQACRAGRQHCHCGWIHVERLRQVERQQTPVGWSRRQLIECVREGLRRNLDRPIIPGRPSRLRGLAHVPDPHVVTHDPVDAVVAQHACKRPPGIEVAPDDARHRQSPASCPVDLPMLRGGAIRVEVAIGLKTANASIELPTRHLQTKPTRFLVQNQRELTLGCQ